MSKARGDNTSTHALESVSPTQSPRSHSHASAWGFARPNASRIESTIRPGIRKAAIVHTLDSRGAPAPVGGEDLARRPERELVRRV